MQDFTLWLQEQKKDRQPRGMAERLGELQTFVETHSAEWPVTRNDPSPFVELIVEKTVSDPQARERLINTFSSYFENWRAANSSAPAGITLGSILLIVFGVIVAAGLFWGIFLTDFIEGISTPANARGLITFLFAFCTIGVVILVALAIFWVDSSELDDRFTRAKDIITILIGVLGTILGFYFGSLSDRDATPLVASITPSAALLEPGGTLTILGAVSGGSGDYTVDVEFAAKDGIDIDPVVPEDGKIAIDIAIPAEIDQPTQLPFTVKISDSDDNRTSWAGSVLVIPAEEEAPADAGDGDAADGGEAGGDGNAGQGDGEAQTPPAADAAPPANQ